MYNFWLKGLISLVFTAFLVSLSDFCIKKRKISREYVIKLLKTQSYYIIMYELFAISIPLLFSISIQLKIQRTILILLYLLELIRFTDNFISHLSKNFHSNIPDIYILQFIINELTFLLIHFLKSIISKIKEIIKKLFE